jgi:hypothetical protein
MQMLDGFDPDVEVNASRFSERHPIKILMNDLTNYEQVETPRSPTARFRTPPRRRSVEIMSPPQAPKPYSQRERMNRALDQNDLVAVVELLAKNPTLAGVPHAHGCVTDPLVRARHLGCDPAIIDALTGAHVEVPASIPIMPRFD